MCQAETNPAMIESRRKLAVQLITFARFKAAGHSTDKPKRQRRAKTTDSVRPAR